MDYDVVIIGAGVVGLACAAIISSKNRSVLLLERHQSFGWETSSRNSEVIHAGMYYKNDSLKAKLCVAGNKSIYDWCFKYNVPVKRIGKFIVATNEESHSRIEEIYKNGIRNGVDDLEIVDKTLISKIEPNIIAHSALWSPNTGIIDSHKFMDSLESFAKSNGCDFAYNHEVIGLDCKNDFLELSVKTNDGDCFKISSTKVVNSAGLDSDKIAKMCGIDLKANDLELKYCRGHYFKISSNKKKLVNHLIYPVPSTTKSFSGLGIHVTIDLAGELKLGPDTEYLSMNEQNYTVNSDLRDKFYQSASSYLMGLNIEDISPDLSGIRPKLQAKGADIRDFYIEEESARGLKGLINLIGIESPGLTSSLEIGKYVNDLISCLG